MKGKYSTLAAITLISILTISLVVEALSSKVYATGEEIRIPLWIKKVAKLWANGEISDSDFLQGIQYLLVQKIMKIPETNADSSSYPEIPPWVKIVAKLWANGRLGDSTIVQGIQFLIQTSFIKLPKTQVQNQAVNLLASPTVWFAPLPEKMGNQFVDSKNFKPLAGQQLSGSRDFMELFTKDAPWNNAEQHVQVFKLYQNWVITASDLKLMQTVTYLNNHNITIAMESGALEHPSTCGDGVEGFGGKKPTLDALNRIKEAGGNVHFIALDEPFYFGSLYSGHNACHFPALQIAEDVTTYVKSIKLFFPDTAIGDIEPIVKGAGVIQYENWLNMYSAVSGTNFPFFVLDNDWSQPNWPMVDKELQTFLHDHKIQSGMIYVGNPTDTSDQEWLAHAEKRIMTYEIEAGGRPDHVIFQSWHAHPYYILPETSSNTFTHLILSYFNKRTTLDIVSSLSFDGTQAINGKLNGIDGTPLSEAVVGLFAGSVDESGTFIQSDVLPVDSTRTDKNGSFHLNLNGIRTGTILQAKYSGDQNHWPSYLDIEIH